MKIDPLSRYAEGDSVVFNSMCRDDLESNGQIAKIVEIKSGITDTLTFPHGLSFCIEFQTLRKTWCRYDEIAKLAI